MSFLSCSLVSDGIVGSVSVAQLADAARRADGVDDIGFGHGIFLSGKINGEPYGSRRQGGPLGR